MERKFPSAMGRGMLIYLMIFLSRIARADDGEVDLGTMGANDFSPYSFERHGAWMMLPIFMIFMVLLHLKRTNKKKKLKGNNK